MKNTFVYVICILILIHSVPAWTQDGTDAYDPFIDYNEFEIADEEEADINFFRNGRFLTAGFTLGQRSFTEGMTDVFEDDVVYGLYLSYFFDMRFAMQFGYLTGSHPISVGSARGDAKISGVSIDLKYYFNTQNVTKGLAALNPYVIGGFTSFSRESVVDGQPEFSKDSATGFNLGLGMEIPMMRNKMYFGAQGMYQLVNFKDESSEIILDGGATPTGKRPTGDFVTLLAIIGVNF